MTRARRLALVAILVGCAQSDALDVESAKEVRSRPTARSDPPSDRRWPNHGRHRLQSILLSARVATDPTVKSLEVGAIMVTRGACPPPRASIEMSFLEALASVSGYSWSQGQLALAYLRNGTFNAMLFDPP